jgi:hypothetical protein
MWPKTRWKDEVPWTGILAKIALKVNANSNGNEKAALIRAVTPEE